MSRIKKFMFETKLSYYDDIAALGFSMGAWVWLLTVLKKLFSSCVIWGIIYLGVGMSLFFIIRKMMSYKRKETATLVKIFCIFTMILYNGVLIYFYTNNISKYSLLITIPISALISLSCVAVWVKLPINVSKTTTIKGD